MAFPQKRQRRGSAAIRSGMARESARAMPRQRRPGKLNANLFRVELSIGTYFCFSRKLIFFASGANLYHTERIGNTSNISAGGGEADWPKGKPCRPVLTMAEMKCLRRPKRRKPIFK